MRSVAVPMLSLAQKGPIQSPPALAEPYERVAREVRAWPGVVAATHWRLGQPGRVDGADFYVGEEELGHLHLDGEVHMPAGRELTEALIATGLARRFRFGAGWIEASIDGEADADRALRLFRLNYDRLQGTPLRKLGERIEAARA